MAMEITWSSNCDSAESTMCLGLNKLCCVLCYISYLGCMALLRPLLLDVVPTIQQTAALALGRLANFNDDLAEAVVKADILPQLVYSLAEQNVRSTLKNKSLFIIE